MKKVILSISAMLFVGAAAIAQNTSAVAQAGNLDTGLVNQNGNLNDASIGQLGDSNTSTVDQGYLPSLYPAVGNIGHATQNGDWNTAFISQSNKNNEAYQAQTGDHNSATVWQDQISGPASALNGGDKAWQTQTGDYNKATIDQGTSGNTLPAVLPAGQFTAAELSALAGVPIPFSPNGGNEATQTQNGDYNLAYASQGGTGNRSSQTQTSPSGTVDADKNISRHFQYGDSNTATTDQNGIKNVENTLQIGSNNLSQVFQSGNGGNNQRGVSIGSWNNIIVHQTNP
jgi:hypothetical protein